MRATFEAELARLERSAASDLGLAAATLKGIAGVVVDPRAESAIVINGAARRLRDHCHASSRSALCAMARQAPVACDLRLLLVMIEVAHHMELIANQFELIAAQIDEIVPEASAQSSGGGPLSQMACAAALELTQAGAALAARDPSAAECVLRDDQLVNRLNRDVFRMALGVDGDAPARRIALRHVLIARSLERVGDNAVDIAEQAAFLATGRYREFTDASHLTAPAA